MNDDEIPEIIDTYKPNLYDIHRAFENFTYRGRFTPIVGNYRARMTMALIYPAKGVSVLVKGTSGSGKSTMIRCVGDMVWGNDVLKNKIPEVFYIADSSDKGYITDTLIDRIENRCTHCLIPELQNAVRNETVEAMIKLWTEGEYYTYSRAQKFGRESKQYNLKPLPILTSIATENRYTEKLGEEMERRFLPLYTIAKKPLNKEIHRTKALARARIDEDLISMTEMERRELRGHFRMVIKEKRKIRNPCALFMEAYIPYGFVISNSQIEYWFDLVDAVTKFYSSERIVFSTPKGKRQYIFSTPQDNWLAWELGGATVVLASMNIPDLGREIIEILPLRDVDWEDARIDINDIIDELKEMGIERTKKQVIGIMKALEGVAYAKRDESFGKSIFYYRTQNYNFEYSVNWTDCIDKTKEFIKAEYPSIADDYIKEFCDDPIVIHPFTNEKIKLLDIEYDGTVEEQRRKERKETVNIKRLDKFLG